MTPKQNYISRLDAVELGYYNRFYNGAMMHHPNGNESLWHTIAVNAMWAYRKHGEAYAYGNVVCAKLSID
jgi:hypothetical protein